MAEREFQAAAETIRGDCAKQIAAAKDMIAAAKQQAYLEEANDPELYAGLRIQAIEQMQREYPEKAKELAKPLAALRAKLETKEAAVRRKEAAERRARGVSIGMTREEVLQSSWGRPTHINRTTYAFGTHEQWVYHGGNYLHFEDGKLTAIQN